MNVTSLPFLHSDSNNEATTSENEIILSNRKVDINLARIFAVSLTGLSLYILLMLIYYSCRRGFFHGGSTATKLSLIAAGFSVLVCFDRLIELWIVNIPCKTFHYVSTITYGMGTAFVYTTLWIRQRKLYSDRALHHTVSKFSRIASAVCIVVIYVLLVSMFGALIVIVQFQKEYPPCHIIWFPLTSLLPLLLFVILTCLCLQVLLYVLILYPLKHKNGICQILLRSVSDNDVHLMLKRLAICACACIFSTILLCLAILLDTIEVVCVYWGNLIAFDLIISTLSVVFSFSDWSKRLFPCCPRFLRKRRNNSVVLPEERPHQRNSLPKVILSTFPRLIKKTSLQHGFNDI